MIGFGNDDISTSSAPFLIKAEEGYDNCIRFIISLACKDEKGSDKNNTGIKELDRILHKAAPIYPDENETYEIVFEDYILHQTRNESYCSIDEYEIQKGKYFIIFEKSRLLDTLPAITDCQTCSDGSVYPGRWSHYGIYCQDHIIDIISHNEPTIRKLTARKHI